MVFISGWLRLFSAEVQLFGLYCVCTAAAKSLNQPEMNTTLENRNSVTDQNETG
jgi:hypothetical protein